ncbi:hypothetical protein EK904_000075, partial [Melospiza melodia maxima]
MSLLAVIGVAEHHLNYQGICIGPETVLQFCKQDE